MLWGLAENVIEEDGSPPLLGADVMRSEERKALLAGKGLFDR